MGGEDIEKKKILGHYDFPPTVETENLRMWDSDALSIKPNPSDYTLKIDLEKESIYETRVYPSFASNKILLKIISKMDKKTKRITAIIRTKLAIYHPTDGRTFTEEEYKNEVKKIEQGIANIYDINRVNIVSGEEMMRSAKGIIDRYEKRKEMEKNESKG